MKKIFLTYSEYSRAARVVRSCSAAGRFVEFCGCNFLSLLLMYTARKGMNSVSSTRSIPTCFNGSGSAKMKFEKNFALFVDFKIWENNGCQDGFTSLIEDFQVNSLVSLRMIHPCDDSFRKINLKPAFVKWLHFYNWNRVVMIAENDLLLTVTIWNCILKLKLAFNGWD